MHPFVGRRVEETPIGASLPGLAERTRGQTTFVVFYMREPLKLDYLWAALCMLGAVYFIFRDGAGA